MKWYPMSSKQSDRLIIAGAVFLAVAIGAAMPFAFAERGGRCAEAQILAEMERQLEVINTELAETKALQEQIQRVSNAQLARELELAAVASETDALMAQLLLTQQLAAARWLCDS